MTRKQNSYPNLSEPEAIDLSELELFYQIVDDTSYGKYLSYVRNLLEKKSTQENIKSDKDYIKKTIVDKVGKIGYKAFIHLLHISMFIKSRHDKPDEPEYMMPVTRALHELLSKVPLEVALNQLPMKLKDILTAHPVDMDRGLISSHKQDFEVVAREWSLKKTAYRQLTSTHERIRTRSDLNQLHDKLKTTILKLLYTPNYRPLQTRPESEQRRLSRSIKDYETTIVQHWSRLIQLVQTIFFQYLLENEMNRSAKLKSQYGEYLTKSSTAENLTRLKEIPVLTAHPLFLKILDLENSLSYRIETWRGDMDGNPYVNHLTMGSSIAYGRKRGFERLSADEAVIHYQIRSKDFEVLESKLATLLRKIKVEGKKNWQQYISGRQKAGWNPVQIYSGLAYYRMVELTESAEEFLRKPGNARLLKEGYTTHNQFLDFIQPLIDLESLVGIKNGVWKYHYQVVQLRQLALGKPHIRNGEKFNLELMNEVIKSLGHPLKLSLRDLSHSALQNILRDYIEKTAGTTVKPGTLSEASKSLLMVYKNMIAIDDGSTLIQSDSGGELSSIELSILLLKAVSKLIKHKGKCVVLCEQESSMKSAITLMEDSSKQFLFEDVIMMCAGSDNQKKLGPFYSAYLNHTFLRVAYENGIDAFFGVGDSPLRSSLHTPLVGMKTFQPGSRKHHFFGERVHSYLSHRLTNHIKELVSYNERQHSPIHQQYQRIFEIFGKSMSKHYLLNIQSNVELQNKIKDISEIVTTYFSRPAKKSDAPRPILDQIRAIDSGRAQLILNTFDPQLIGFNVGLNLFFEELEKAGIPTSTCHSFFNKTSEGQSLLNTIEYFANMLDDDLLESKVIRTVSQADLAVGYKRLSGHPLVIKFDQNLRMIRLLWQVVYEHPELRQYNAQTLILFGANWMI